MVGIEGTMGRMSDSEDPTLAINDPAAWGPPKKGRKSEKRQRSTVVSVRMTQDELAAIQEKAKVYGHTIGTYMREVALTCQPQLHWEGLLTQALVSNGVPLTVTSQYRTHYDMWQTEAVGLAGLMTAVPSPVD